MKNTSSQIQIMWWVYAHHYSWVPQNQSQWDRRGVEMHSNHTANTVLIGDWWNCQPIWETEIAEVICRHIFFLFSFIKLQCTQYIYWCWKSHSAAWIMGHLPNLEAISNLSSLKVQKMVCWTVSMVTPDQNTNRAYQDVGYIPKTDL